MLYIVEMTLTPGHTDKDWYQWVNGMKPPERFISVPGFRSVQRFKGLSDPLAYCAVYSVTGAEVMTSPAYKGMGGGVHNVGYWNSHLDYWHRDLVDGVAIAPAVPEGYVLLIKKATALDFPDEGLPFIRLTTIGLDKSTPYRGIAVVPEEEAGRRIEKNTEIRTYKAIAPQLIDVNSSC